MRISLLVAIALFATSARAQPLTIVHVGATQINRIFSPTGTVDVVDVSDEISLAGGARTGFLQSRTFRGLAGAPAAGAYGYEYRIDLRKIIGYADIPAVRALTIETGPIIDEFDYDGNGTTGEHVYVITRGGLGSVAPMSAEQVGNTVTFRFSPPVAAGGRPDAGESTFFFGFASRSAPRTVQVQLVDGRSLELTLQGRAPAHPLSLVLIRLIDWLRLLPIDGVSGASYQLRETRKAIFLKEARAVQLLIRDAKYVEARKLVEAWLTPENGSIRWVQDVEHTEQDERKEINTLLLELLERLPKNP